MQDTREQRLYSEAMNQVADSDLHRGNRSSSVQHECLLCPFTQDKVYYVNKLNVIITKVRCRPSRATTKTSSCEEAHKEDPCGVFPTFAGDVKYIGLCRVVDSLDGHSSSF